MSSIISAITQRHGSLPGTHTHSEQPFHLSNARISLSTYSLKWVPAKIQHFKRSNTVVTEIKLLRKLCVTLNLRFIELGRGFSTPVALGFFGIASILTSADAVLTLCLDFFSLSP